MQMLIIKGKAICIQYASSTRALVQTFGNVLIRARSNYPITEQNNLESHAARLFFLRTFCTAVVKIDKENKIQIKIYIQFKYLNIIP